MLANFASIFIPFADAARTREEMRKTGRRGQEVRGRLHAAVDNGFFPARQLDDRARLEFDTGAFDGWQANGGFDNEDDDAVDDDEEEEDEEDHGDDPVFECRYRPPPTAPQRRSRRLRNITPPDAFLTVRLVVFSFYCDLSLSRGGGQTGSPRR